MTSRSRGDVGVLKAGARVTVRHGLFWLRHGSGTIRATYKKEGRHFASVELDGSGKILPRLLSQLQLVDKEKG
jgi:hypothetical protein